MVKPLDPREVVSIQEIAISNMYEIEALIQVLARKGIVSKEEVLEEIKKMRAKVEVALICEELSRLPSEHLSS